MVEYVRDDVSATLISLQLVTTALPWQSLELDGIC